jgi:hypothetical protein
MKIESYQDLDTWKLGLKAVKTFDDKYAHS